MRMREKENIEEQKARFIFISFQFFLIASQKSKSTDLHKQ